MLCIPAERWVTQANYGRALLRTVVHTFGTLGRGGASPLP